jgi:hypothetical protein
MSKADRFIAFDFRLLNLSHPFCGLAYGDAAWGNLAQFKSRTNEFLCLKHSSKNDPPRSLN